MSDSTPQAQLAALRARLDALGDDARYLKSHGGQRQQHLAAGILAATQHAAQGTQDGCGQAIGDLKAVQSDAQASLRAGKRAQRLAEGAINILQGLVAIVWTAPGLPTLTVASPSPVAAPAEGDEPLPLFVPLRLNRPLDADGSVAWLVSGWLTTDLADGKLSGAAPIPAGQTAVSLPLMLAPQTLRSARTGTVTLSAPVGCQIGLPLAATVELLPNGGLPPPPPGLSVALADLARAAKSEPAGKPITIKAATSAWKGDCVLEGPPRRIAAEQRLGAMLDGQLAIVRDGQTLTGLAITSGGVKLSGHGAGVDRCFVHGMTKQTMIELDGGSACFAIRCELADMTCDASGHGWGIRVIEDPKNPQAQPLVALCYLHDWHAVGGGGHGQHLNANEGCQIGVTNTNSRVPARGMMIWCYFENVSVDSEFISLKSSFNTVALSTFVGNDAHLSSRHGTNNMILFNWLERCLGISVQDRDGLCWGNYLTGCKQMIQAQAGDTAATDDWHAHGTHPACTNWRFGANVGDSAKVAAASFGAGFNVKPTYTELPNSPPPADLPTWLAGAQAVRLSPAMIGPASTWTPPLLPPGVADLLTPLS
jgi:hypothetical protein